MTALNPALHRFGDVTVRLSVELGRTDMPLREVLALDEGSVVPLNRLTDELLDVTANGRVIAHGEVVAEDGRFALRIVSLAGESENGDAIAANSETPAVAPLDEASAPE
ncbi:MAG: FliM/FliN family flagellar motor switch protein [Erythrobacter sp.]|nr:FliM/FliN family flagellar motor switch protein [Erythrobacter sp.]